jgi:hypothetical protein
VVNRLTKAVGAAKKVVGLVSAVTSAEVRHEDFPEFPEQSSGLSTTTAEAAKKRIVAATTRPAPEVVETLPPSATPAKNRSAAGGSESESSLK